MKTSLRKLRGFALHHHHKHHASSKGRRDLLRPLAQLDEFAQSTTDMQDMRDCYDSLLSAAAATANSAYEFSESLRELGACLLEKTAMNDDEESGRVLLMLGKVQYELQKLVDSYRSHILQTITAPSESLLNELQTVEEMKRQCDEKREVYEFMVTRHRENGKSKNMRADSFALQQLQEAHDEYEEEATLFIFRLKSLKQGQSRSLLTQAARHHAAQLQFFKKALKSLEAVEPHVKSVTERQHIDYLFCGLDDDDYGDYEDDDSHDDSELSFDYGQTDHDHQDAVSPSKNSMELDQVDLTFPKLAPSEAAKENFNRSHEYYGDVKKSSQSAPLFAEKMLESPQKVGLLRQSASRKFHSYALPTPENKKGLPQTRSSIPVLTRQIGLNWRMQNLSHSTPLERKRYSKITGSEKSPSSNVPNLPSVLKESNNNTAARLPPPLSEALLFSQFERHDTSESKKFKRHAFSGPLLSKQSKKPPPSLYSGPLLRNPVPQPLPSSPPMSKSASPPFVSSPKISELHELPRPPANSTFKSARPLGLIGHSAPLGLKGKELSATGKSTVTSSGSPLPTPQQTITRSFSIPTSGPRSSKLPEDSEMGEDMASPPLTPMLISNKPPQTSPNTVSPAVRITGAD